MGGGSRRTIVMNVRAADVGARDSSVVSTAGLVVLLVPLFLLMCGDSGVADDVNIAVVPAECLHATIWAFVRDVSYHRRYSLGIHPGASSDPAAGRAVGGKDSIELWSVPCRREV